MFWVIYLNNVQCDIFVVYILLWKMWKFWNILHTKWSNDFVVCFLPWKMCDEKILEYLTPKNMQCGNFGIFYSENCAMWNFWSNLLWKMWNPVWLYIFLFSFWENWRYQKDIPKLIDLFMGVDFHFRTSNFDIRASGEGKCKNEYCFDNRSPIGQNWCFGQLNS